MKKSQTVYTDLLHSFVDNELDDQESQYVLDAQLNDSAVAKEICELRKLKDLMKAARPTEDELVGAIDVPKQKFFLFDYGFSAVSALLILLSVIVAGIFVNQDSSRQFENASLIYPDVKTFIGSRSEDVDVNVVLHVNRDDSASELFAQLDQLLHSDKADNGTFRVEVIASGPGLSLARTNKPTNSDKIREIRKQYDNVVFVACQTTLNHLMKMVNRKIDLLPEVMLTASGPELIRLRKSQGWAYIKI